MAGRPRELRPTDPPVRLLPVETLKYPLLFLTGHLLGTVVASWVFPPKNVFWPWELTPRRVLQSPKIGSWGNS